MYENINTVRENSSKLQRTVTNNERCRIMCTVYFKKKRLHYVQYVPFCPPLVCLSSSFFSSFSPAREERNRYGQFCIMFSYAVEFLIIKSTYIFHFKSWFFSSFKSTICYYISYSREYESRIIRIVSSLLKIHENH